KASLGFYLSGHPFTAYRAEIGRFVRTNLRSLVASAEGDGGTRTQLIAGVVESVRVQRTQGGRMVVLTLSDGTATQEVTVYNEVFDQYRDTVKEEDRKSTRLNSSHLVISYAVFCLKKKTTLSTSSTGARTQTVSPRSMST